MSHENNLRKNLKMTFDGFSKFFQRFHITKSGSQKGKEYILFHENRYRRYQKLSYLGQGLDGGMLTDFCLRILTGVCVATVAADLRRICNCGLFTAADGVVERSRFNVARL